MAAPVAPPTIAPAAAPSGRPVSTPPSMPPTTAPPIAPPTTSWPGGGGGPGGGGLDNRSRGRLEARDHDQHPKGRTWTMTPDTKMEASSSTAASAARSLAAQRMRAHRRRRRAGLRCLMVQLFETEIDELIRKGLLKDVARNDRHAVCEALYKHLDRTLGSAQ